MAGEPLSPDIGKKTRDYLDSTGARIDDNLILIDSRTVPFAQALGRSQSSLYNLEKRGAVRHPSGVVASIIEQSTGLHVLGSGLVVVSDELSPSFSSSAEIEVKSKEAAVTAARERLEELQAEQALLDSTIAELAEHHSPRDAVLKLIPMLSREDLQAVYQRASTELGHFDLIG
jgi:hypothetical protein